MIYKWWFPIPKPWVSILKWSKIGWCTFQGYREKLPKMDWERCRMQSKLSKMLGNTCLMAAWCHSWESENGVPLSFFPINISNFAVKPWYTGVPQSFATLVHPCASRLWGVCNPFETCYLFLGFDWYNSARLRGWHRWSKMLSTGRCPRLLFLLQGRSQSLPLDRLSDLQEQCRVCKQEASRTEAGWTHVAHTLMSEFCQMLMDLWFRCDGR